MFSILDKKIKWQEDIVDAVHVGLIASGLSAIWYGDKNLKILNISLFNRSPFI